ncbi:DUF6483 family protein [Carnobacterium gallinarum]|uniref:DUF6483 family protein n=1 Tax=Carnobacterium gallinarum TaxID=2749 RepID=UPI00054E4DA6|nr:DUF6483 family protein [Carnobacterium gallinarum]
MYKQEDDFIMRQVNQMTRGLRAILGKDRSKLDIEIHKNAEGALLPIHDFLQQLLDKGEIQQAETFLKSIQEQLTNAENEKLAKWLENELFLRKYNL